MPHADDALPTVAPPELLVACFTREGKRSHSNPEWDRILGTGDEAWGRLDPEDRVFAAEYLSEAASGSLVTNHVFVVMQPERDQPVPVLLNFIPAHLNGEDGRLGVRGVTVTGEVLLEPTTWTAGQTQRRRMEMLGRMAMGIAHDFNNLLTGIIGHTELISTTMANPEESMTRYLHTIEQAALDGAALVRKIQQYVRKEKRTRFEPVDLPTLFQDCISLTRPYWYNEPRRQGIVIDVVTELADVPLVMGSATELREVFVNMLLNAVQAMPDGGNIHIRTRTDEQRGVIAEIQDSGTGMPDHVKARIFEPMFTTKGEQGTGMGLAVSFGIIREHEGDIDVITAPGQGTRFVMNFPVATDVKQTTEVEELDEPDIEAKILVVDDEEMVRNVLKRLLTLKGHTIVEAASGPAALDKLADDASFDLMFTDLGMPDMSGRELGAQVRARYPSLPIVLVTGHTDLEDQGPNIDLIVRKPFKLDELQKIIQFLLRTGNRSHAGGVTAEHAD